MTLPPLAYQSMLPHTHTRLPCALKNSTTVFGLNSAPSEPAHTHSLVLDPTPEEVSFSLESPSSLPHRGHVASTADKSSFPCITSTLLQRKRAMSVWFMLGRITYQWVALVRLWIIPEIPVNSKTYGNCTPISAMLICSLNSKFQNSVNLQENQSISN